MDVFLIELVPSLEEVVGDFVVQTLVGIGLLDRISSFQVRAGRGLPLVSLLQPALAASVDRLDLELQLFAGRFQDRAGDHDVDRVRGRHQAHRTPIAGRLDGLHEMKGHVPRLGLSHVREDALLLESEELVIVGRQPGIEDLDSDVEKLFLRDFRLDSDQAHSPVVSRPSRRSCQTHRREKHDG